ncbi:MAG TPA: hypothetical protein PLX89_02340 [Verrucomicrobiota bacterium]|nr:hypothetical protein [Verrucomicrobiales bacterium]HRI11817.1 hypothetical protein [Verrucomicrobiota bacterium]
MKTMPKLWSSIFNILLLARAVEAQKIDFETLPNGNPTTGGLVISNQFSAPPYGVSFRFEDGKFPVIRKVGGSINGRPTAFWGPPNSTTFNQPATGQNVGTSFLSDSDAVDEPPAPLVVTYAQPVAAASGFIIDIDSDESWRVEARDAAGHVLAQVELKDGDHQTGDGIASPWSFALPAADIQSIRIVFTGRPDDLVGLAFDNFSPAESLPTPGPVHLNAKREADNIILSLVGTPLAIYRIEQANSANNPDWVELTSVVASSPSVTLTNTIMAEQRLFRAVGVE